MQSDVPHLQSASLGSLPSVIAQSTAGPWVHELVAALQYLPVVTVQMDVPHWQSVLDGLGLAPTMLAQMVGGLCAHARVPPPPQASWHVKEAWLHPDGLAVVPSSHSQYPDAEAEIVTSQLLSLLGSRGPSCLHPPVCRHETQPAGAFVTQYNPVEDVQSDEPQ